MKIIIILLISALVFTGCVQPTAPEGNAGGNSSPVINKITADPLFVSVGTTTTITVDAADPDGDNLSYSWTVALGDIIGNGSQVRYTAAFCCVGINTINVEVKDSKGAVAIGTINLEVNP
jgi:PBP1b-binding outer membrane lipoprotein LpoB